MPLNFNNPYSGSALALPKFTVHYRSNVRVLSLPEYRILCIDHYWNTTDFAIIPALEAMETLTKYCTYPQLRLLLVGKISLLGDLRFPSYRPKKTLVYNRVPRNIPVINIPVIRCVPVVTVPNSCTGHTGTFRWQNISGSNYLIWVIKIQDDFFNRLRTAVI